MSLQPPARCRRNLPPLARALSSAALALLAAACSDAPPASSSIAVAAMAGARCSPQMSWRLYFGFDTPDGAIGEHEWHDFVDREVVPRLADGFTVLAGSGRWRDRDGRSRAEESRVVEVVADDSLALRQQLAEIAGRYKLRFRQQAVLLTQTATRACL